MQSPLKRIKRFLRNHFTEEGRKAQEEEKERLRLHSMQRYQETTTLLPGFPFTMPDAASFLSSWSEIFDRQFYKFKAASESPRILDCGANVGLSCLYFGKLFPKAKITAFEPDPRIFSFLKTNLQNAGLGNVELVQKAVWSETTTLQFQSEGSDAGRVRAEDKTSTLIQIPAVRLRDYMDGPIDMLKIDIEGAETEVMNDISGSLHLVRNIFVEYHSFSGREQTLPAILSILSSAGFRYHLQPTNSAPQPLVSVPDYFGMDMQVNIFGYRN